MFKIEIENEVRERTLKMSDLKPCQLAVITDCTSDSLNCKGHIVMRTANTRKFEVMDLSTPGDNCCWVEYSSLRVKLLPKGTKITLTVE